MSDLILYLIMAGIGYFVGSKVRDKKEKLKWTGKVQTVAIILLVTTMGARMGANDEVIENLSSIGIYSLVVTIFVMVFALLSIFLVRKLMGMNRYGTFSEDETVVNHGSSNEKPKGKINSMTIIIVICVAIGMALGHFFALRVFSDFDTFSSFAGTVINVGLCVLLWFVGLDLGLDGTAVATFKKVGLRVIIFPFVIAIGSLIGAAVAGIFIPLSLKEMLAIGGGLGWYSLAPGIIMDAGYVTASAISFLHNVMRELFSIILIPIVADKIGYVETISMPGAAAMDVCLPIVEKSTSSHIAVYSFISGLILSALVPILVPILVAL